MMHDPLNIGCIVARWKLPRTPDNDSSKIQYLQLLTIECNKDVLRDNILVKQVHNNEAFTCLTARAEGGG